MTSLSEPSLISAPKCVIGIDPGLSGAVCKLGKGCFKVWRDFRHLPEIALAVKEAASEAPAPSLAVIEAVHAFPGQGVCSVWSFAEATATARTALQLCCPAGTASAEVAPQRWQNFFRSLHKTGREFDSRAVASWLFPSYTSLFKRKLDHNTADAVLITAWAMVQGQ